MNKLKHFLKQHKVTLMIIPNSEKSIKQWKFNLAVGSGLLVLLIVLNIVVLINTAHKTIVSNQLQTLNSDLNSNLLQQEDKIKALEDSNKIKSNELLVLKNTLDESSTYLDARLSEIDEMESTVTQLIALFNEETNSNIDVPISRSFDRMNPLDTTSSMNNSLKNSSSLISNIEFLTQSEEISDLIQVKSSTYDTLITELENRLTYLDCRPDFYPTTGQLTSTFGARQDPVYGNNAIHYGIDIANATGTAIYAAGDGIVTYSEYSNSYGNVLIIDHGYGYQTVYAHCSKRLMNEGETVSKGQQIATMGCTGKSTGTHLHFEIRYNKTPINPLTLLKTNQ